MNEPKLKAPTRKVFHFPKSDGAKIVANGGSATSVTSKPVKRSRAAVSKKAAAVAVRGTSATTSTASRPAPKKALARKAALRKAATGNAAARSAGKPASRKSSPKKSAVTKGAAEAAKTDAAPAEKAKREKKEKVVRDSFTMPKSDYAKIATLKQRCLDAGIHVKKSELLRAGLALLEGASEKRLAAALSDLETVKTGRPAKN